MPVKSQMKLRSSKSVTGDVGSATFCTGMSMGLIHDVMPVKELLDNMVAEAEADLRQVLKSFED